MTSPYTKEEILQNHYKFEDNPFRVNEWDLFHVISGREEIVMSYSSLDECRALWEEDALFHWSNVLRRDWKGESDGS